MRLKNLLPYYITNFIKFTPAVFWIFMLIFSSSQFNFNLLNKASAESCSNNLAISAVKASSSDADSPPSNVLDNDRSTKWSSPTVGSWIQVDLGATKNICSVDIA
jgi:F5/8 type C domain